MGAKFGVVSRWKGGSDFFRRRLNCKNKNFSVENSNVKNIGGIKNMPTLIPANGLTPEGVEVVRRMIEILKDASGEQIDELVNLLKSKRSRNIESLKESIVKQKGNGNGNGAKKGNEHANSFLHIKKEVLEKALKDCDYNCPETAALLGVPLDAVIKHKIDYGLRKP